MSEPITISFVATKELKKQIEQWAQEQERSVSYIMRQLLIKETQRRQIAQVHTQSAPINQ